VPIKIFFVAFRSLLVEDSDVGQKWIAAMRRQIGVDVVSSINYNNGNGYSSNAPLEDLVRSIDSHSDQLRVLSRETREIKTGCTDYCSTCANNLDKVLSLSVHLVDDVKAHMSKMATVFHELDAKVQELTKANKLLNSRLKNVGASSDDFFIFVWIRNLIFGTIPPNSSGYHPQSWTEFTEYVASIFGIGHLGSIFHAFAGDWLCDYWNVKPPGGAKVRNAMKTTFIIGVRYLTMAFLYH